MLYTKPIHTPTHPHPHTHTHTQTHTHTHTTIAKSTSVDTPCTVGRMCNKNH